MATTYPGAADTFTAKIDNTDIVHAAEVNNLQDAVRALQITLGANPQTSNATVSARVTLLESTLTALQGTVAGISTGGSGSSTTPTYVSVKGAPYNAAGNGSTNDTTAIQAAIDAVSAGGGGVVFVPRGTYSLASTLYIKEGVTLMGEGRKSTIFKAANFSNQATIIQFFTGNGTTANAHNAALMNCRIDGNRANQSAGEGVGIQMITNPLWVASSGDGASTGWDMHNHVVDVSVWSTRGDGYQANGRAEHNLTRVFIRDAGRHGFNVTADSQFSQCVAGVNQNIGFFVNGQGSVRMAACKAWYSGMGTVTDGQGFRVSGSTYGCVVFSGCEAQDNRAQGLLIDSSSSVMWHGGFDSNSVSSVGGYCAVELVSATGCIIDGAAMDRQAPGGGNEHLGPTQANALKITSSTGNMIRMTHRYGPAAGGGIGTGVKAGSTTTGNEILILTINSGGGYTATRVTA